MPSSRSPVSSPCSFGRLPVRLYAMMANRTRKHITGTPMTSVRLGRSRVLLRRVWRWRLSPGEQKMTPRALRHSHCLHWSSGRVLHGPLTVASSGCRGDCAGGGNCPAPLGWLGNCTLGISSLVSHFGQRPCFPEYASGTRIVAAQYGQLNSIAMPTVSAFQKFCVERISGI